MGFQIKELRQKISPEDIKRILSRLDVYAVNEDDKQIIFPTACHNISGGSPKLYYYKEQKIFKCYTKCNKMFDIFDLIMRIKATRGEEITLKQSIEFTEVEQTTSEISKNTAEEFEYIKELIKRNEEMQAENDSFEILDKKILTYYPFDIKGVETWIKEGINLLALNKFDIRYDEQKNAIIIPNLDDQGNLIGIRARFLNPNSMAKYMPLLHNNKILSHRTSKMFYGYYQNKETINNSKVVIIFEGEKSVLKMESYFPSNNFSLATLGQTITLDHLDLLLKLDIKELILAYDKDYTNQKEAKEVLTKYEKIVSFLKPYYNVSIIMDYGNILDYKDSPIDKGKENFEELLRKRVKL